VPQKYSVENLLTKKLCSLAKLSMNLLWAYFRSMLIFGFICYL